MAAHAATYAANDLGIIVDNGTATTDITVTDTGPITSLALTLGFSVCGTSFVGTAPCSDNASLTFNGELFLQLISGLGTVIDLVIPDSYSGQTGGASVLVTFEDGAAAIGGNKVQSGTFAPVENLASLFGEEAFGTWSILIGDDASSDPKRLDSYSLTVNGGGVAAVPLPAALPLLLIGLGGLGFAGRRRRAS